MPEPDRILWAMVRNRGVNGWKFRRRVPLGARIVDFYCPEARLVVEITGAAEDRQSVLRQDAELSALGYGVLRLPRDVVLNRPAAARAEIVGALATRR